MLSVLMIDDEISTLKIFRHVLERAGFSPILFDCPSSALYYIKKYGHEVDVVVTDFHMPIMNGLELIQAMRELGYGIPVILHSGHIDGIDMERAEALRARVIKKPAQPNDLIDGIATAHSNSRVGFSQ